MLTDVYENFRDRCIDTYEPDPAHFLSAPGLAWQACLKKTKVKLELLTDNDMLMIVEKGIRGEMCNAMLYIDMQKQTINIRRIIIKILSQILRIFRRK